MARCVPVTGSKKTIASFTLCFTVKFYIRPVHRVLWSRGCLLCGATEHVQSLEESCWLVVPAGSKTWRMKVSEIIVSSVQLIGQKYLTDYDRQWMDQLVEATRVWIPTNWISNIAQCRTCFRAMPLKSTQTHEFESKPMWIDWDYYWALMMEVIYLSLPFNCLFYNRLSHWWLLDK